MNPTHANPSRRSTPLGFTLIELLVGIAIIALLIGILLPALGAARQSAKDMLCKSNMRQLTTATMLYADDYKGRFPTNIGGPHVIDPENGKRNLVWHDINRIGQYLPQEDFRNVAYTNVENPTIGGTVVRCPNHPEGGRSYTMNYWASSAGEYTENQHLGTINALKPGSERGEPSYQMGQSFNNDVSRASSVMLFTEGWAPFKSELEDHTGETTWFTEATAGRESLPGERFGGGDGAVRTPSWRNIGTWAAADPGSPEMRSGTTEAPKSYIPYYRHPKRSEDLFGLIGGADLAFVDGHVEHYDVKDLVNLSTGRSTYKVLWSPTDEKVERRELGPED